MNSLVLRNALLVLLTCILSTACTVGVVQREELAHPPSETPPAPSPFPALEKRLALAPEGEWLHDLLLDKGAKLLYVTDTADQLHVLDAETYAELAVLPAGGGLLLDAAHERLYVSTPWRLHGTTTVVDTASLTVTGVISGGPVTLDTARNRLYAGYSSILVYDGATLEKLGEIPMFGAPVYNPLRDEVYVSHDTVYQIDAETWQVRGDLLTNLTARVCPQCPGRIATGYINVYPERNLVAVNMHDVASSSGAGYEIAPPFFDATTLEQITDPTLVPATTRGCQFRLILTEPVDGRTYRREKFTTPMPYNNLMVYGSDGMLETWRDGLAAGVTNPHTSQMYTPYLDSLLVLDLPALTPVGTLAAACVHSLDAESGMLYTFDGGDLVVFAEQGGDYEPPVGSIEPQPTTSVYLIKLSPDYPTDRTLFVGFYGESDHLNKLYRSTDGGQTWTYLRGGLPESEFLSPHLALSPGFAQDHTMFAGGYIQSGQGIGVYRSIDGGDTWKPMWNGLSHLRIYDIILSPNYPADGTLLAYAEYKRITPSENGRSIHRSTDRGVNWSLVMTATEKAALPHPEELLPPGPAAPDVRFRETAGPPYGIERSIDGGRTWHAISLGRLSNTIHFEAILPSPNLAADHTVYILTNFGLFRSTDDGATWQRPLDERLTGPLDWSQSLITAALTPPLEDGRQQLFVGTAAGLLVLDPEALTWVPVEIAPQWPTVLGGKMVNAIKIDPDGRTWMSDHGSGLARYANGTIQARYTITDGLPSPYVNAIATAPDGSIWIGTSDGIARFDPSADSDGGHSWTTYPFAEELGDPSVQDVAVASDGTIWVGSSKPGLLHWDGQRWEHITDPENRIGDHTLDIEIAPDGTLWCATSAGLALYKDGTWSIGWSGEVFAVELGPAGSAYIVEGKEDHTVWRYVDGEWQSLHPVGDPYIGAVLHVADDGAVWIGTLHGAFRYDGQTWHQFSARDGLPHDHVYAIAEDAAGWLWFGTFDGAARVDPATLNLTPVQR